MRARFRSKIPTVFGLGLFLLMIPVFAHATGFLHTRGYDIVDEQGQKVLLRSVGLGNWFLPEGYMWHFGDKGDRPRRIEAIVGDLIGPEAAARFWTQYRRQFIAEADLQRIAALGFNCVRPALNARLFLTEGDHPAEVREGFELLDNLVAWARKAGIYVIIDMHAAPGGQTGANIDDSADDQPRLFMDPANQQRLIDLWVKIASRYKDEPTVGGYDLLNEPLPERTGAAAKYKAQLEPLYQRITAAIRAVDRKHMITVEGADWANEWSVFTRPFDPNLVYQFHYYCWDRPTHLNSIQKYLDHRQKLGAPIWGGETGEKDSAIYWATTDYFEANNVGWSFWPWKKMDTGNTPYSVKSPPGWDAITAYSRGQGKPSREEAQKAFDGLLQNIRLENCTYVPAVVNAIFRRVPGRIEAENYGHQGPGRSYYVKANAQKSAHYRTSEPVPIDLIGTGRGRDSSQAIRLSAQEWTAYQANCETARSCAVTVRVRAESAPASFTLNCNGQTQDSSVTGTSWAEVKLQPVSLARGTNDYELLVRQGTVSFDWLEFE
jgi:hypothetical protein